MEHTALPWKAEAVQHDEFRITAPDSPLDVATIYSANDATLIVRAVNNHDALLSALEFERQIQLADDAEAYPQFMEMRDAAILAAKGD